MICTECKKNEAIHEQEDKALCESCMSKLDLVWHPDWHEFVSRYEKCPDCGGTMTWCSACEMYTQDCCVEYGTCQCS